jgi:hypothetical protein
MDSYLIRARIQEGIDIEVWIIKHQMDIKEELGVGAQGLHGLRTETQVWHKMPVHDVEMHPLEPCIFHDLQTVSKVSVVAG